MLVERTHEPIALAVVDLEMPYMNGVELGERLKQVLPELPILLISGTGKLAGLVSPTIDATLPKPVQPECLFEEVSRLLSIRGERV